MKKLQTYLFYLLVLLLPTQLGRHFFFNFSFIQGIRSDYLAPTIYLTDILIFFLIGLEVVNTITSSKLEARSTKSETLRILNLFRVSSFEFRILLIVVCYLLFSSIIVASNTFTALYKTVKIGEFILLSIVIVRLKPPLQRIVTILSLATLYSCVIAIWQFFLQRSIGGFLWFLGERTFYASTPAIAAFTFNGKLLLRPYGTFSHPNVLAGFLSVMLPLLGVIVFKMRKSSPFRYFLSSTAFILGFCALILTFSRGVWVVTAAGFLFIFLNSLHKTLVKRQWLIIILFYGFLLASILIPFVLPFGWEQSFSERKQLLLAAIGIWAKYPLLGVGLNNSIVQSTALLSRTSNLFIFQPVHNVFLLIGAELGIIGLIGAITLYLSALFSASTRNGAIFIALTQLFLLGLFDHYLFTLQQGQMLLTLFASLTFVHYNKKIQ